jgi:hypothetical protein
LFEKRSRRRASGVVWGDPGTADRRGRSDRPAGPRRRGGRHPPCAGGAQHRGGRVDRLSRVVWAGLADPQGRPRGLDNDHRHGQARPVTADPNELITVPDGPIINAINAAWAQKHPNNTKLIVAGTDDDLWQSYLSDNSQAACDFVKSYLWNHAAQGDGVNKNPVTVQHSGLAQIWAGADAGRFFGVPVGNGHYPDVFGKVQEGVVYSGPTKLAEHGGMNTGDRHVLMVVSGPGIPVQALSGSVETTQVAPTILALLGLDPNKLTAVQAEGTQVLPGLGRPHQGR